MTDESPKDANTSGPEQQSNLLGHARNPPRRRYRWGIPRGGDAGANVAGNRCSRDYALLDVPEVYVGMGNDIMQHSV